MGKPIAGGIPAAAYGFSQAVAERLEAILPRDERADTGGIGGTAAANVLSLAAMRATFHKMAVMSPATSEADADLHTSLYEEAAAVLAG